MTIFDTIILGIIEGVTEFLPISSTGHLIVVSEFLGIEQTSLNKAFEVIIQFAAILAVILNYPSKFTFKHISLWTKVFIAFFPILLILKKVLNFFFLLFQFCNQSFLNILRYSCLIFLIFVNIDLIYMLVFLFVFY